MSVHMHSEFIVCPHGYLLNYLMLLFITLLAMLSASHLKNAFNNWRNLKLVFIDSLRNGELNLGLRIIT